jgi:hypothetical protein
LKLPEEITGETFQDIRKENELLNKTPLAQEIEQEFTNGIASNENTSLQQRKQRVKR